MTKSNSFFILLMVIGLGLFCQSSALAGSCTFKGKPISLDVASATKGISGSVQCRYGQDSAPSTEIVFKKGKALKVKEFYRQSGKIKGEYGVINPNRGTSDQSNLNGLSKEWSEKGVLKSERLHKMGRNIWSRVYNEKGNLGSFTDYGEDDSQKSTSIEFTTSGKIENLFCGTAFSFAEHRKLCGYSGKSVVPLYDREDRVEAKSTFLNGKLLETVKVDAQSGQETESHVRPSGNANGVKVERFENGKVKQETRYNQAGKLDGLQKEFAKTGQLTREASFGDGFMVEERLFYLNGQKKKETVRTNEGLKGAKATVLAKEYWDNGKLMKEGSYHEVTRQSSFGWGYSWSFQDLREFGKHSSWYEDGELESELYWQDGKKVGVWKWFAKGGLAAREQTYEDDVLVRKREFSKKRLILDDELFPDGSRKSHLKK